MDYRLFFQQSWLADVTVNLTIHFYDLSLLGVAHALQARRTIWGNQGTRDAMNNLKLFTDNEEAKTVSRKHMSLLGGVFECNAERV